MNWLYEKATEAVAKWLYGLTAAIIGGGASAVVTGVTVGVVDPSDFNLAAGMNQMLMVMGVSFILHGALAAAMYLQKSPLPEWDGVTERRTRP